MRTDKSERRTIFHHSISFAKCSHLSLVLCPNSDLFAWINPGCLASWQVRRYWDYVRRVHCLFEFDLPSFVLLTVPVHWRCPACDELASVCAIRSPPAFGMLIKRNYLDLASFFSICSLPFYSIKAHPPASPNRNLVDKLRYSLSAFVSKWIRIYKRSR